MPADRPAPILILEDDAGVRQTIQWVLEDEGLEVRVARDGVVGLDHAREERPSLVILDIGLPRLSGDGFAEELHRLYGTSVPILVVTADGRAEEKARRVGAFDFMQKPFDVDELVAAVWRGLG
jgi:DNA-binding response OmpR family regulator